MHKFFVLRKYIIADKVTLLDKDQLYHIQRVLRVKMGDKLVVFDELGYEYNCVVLELEANKIVLRVKEKHLSPKTKRVNLSVACAIPKRSKFDDIIDKLTQLGVDKIIPLKTERVVVKLNKDKEVARNNRWKKIAFNAVQQCQRSQMVVVEPIKTLKDALRDAGEYDLKIIPTLEGGRRSLKEVFVQAKPRNILVLIGPEGDFTLEEVELAKDAGFIPVSLGDLVLRVETAAVAVASFVMLNEDH